jgi:hypothetical protein
MNVEVSLWCATQSVTVPQFKRSREVVRHSWI